MKLRSIVLIFALSIGFGCHDPDEDFTSIREAEFNLLGSENEIIADGFSEYEFEIRLPGVRNGSPQTVSLNTTWGQWVNDSSAINVAVQYNAISDAYVETVRLNAERSSGPFVIQLNENTSPLRTTNLEAQPNFPLRFQIVSDSVEIQLSPGNSTQLRALFFSENGFPSDAIRYQFETDANVNIFPDEVLIQSSEASATLQITTETVSDTINIYGSIPELGSMQPTIDTLRIAIIND